MRVVVVGYAKTKFLEQPGHTVLQRFLQGLSHSYRLSTILTIWHVLGLPGILDQIEPIVGKYLTKAKGNQVLVFGRTRWEPSRLLLKMHRRRQRSYISKHFSSIDPEFHRRMM